MSRIAIVGTGLVGTSIGLALKARKGDFEIVGHDREYGRALDAKKLGALDRAEWNLPSALEKASLVVVATPLNAMERLFSQMAEFLEPECIVTDTANLKAPTLAWAEAAWGERVHYVGGDPIVGLDGDRKPAATLFQGRTYCVIASPTASSPAVDQVIRFVNALGADPLFLDPTEHDSYVAMVSQLPSFLASGLMAVAAGSSSWRDGQRLAGRVFSAATEASQEDSDELLTQFVSNREVLAGWILALQNQLADLGRLLDDDPAELRKALAAARDRRAAWRPGAGPKPEDAPVDLPRARDQFSSWFFGGLAGRQKRP
ncbi:MAG: prephenate dehydrogenase [Chloroflexota bacterium]